MPTIVKKDTAMRKVKNRINANREKIRKLKEDIQRDKEALTKLRNDAAA